MFAFAEPSSRFFLGICELTPHRTIRFDLQAFELGVYYDTISVDVKAYSVPKYSRDATLGSFRAVEEF